MVGESPAVRAAVQGPDSPFGKVRSMVFPRNVLAGHGVLEQLGTCCQQFDFAERGMVVTGPKTLGLAGKRGEEILRASGFDVGTVVAHDSTLEEVDRVTREVEAAGARFLVAIGGGSKIDITKVAAARLKVP